MKNLLVPIIIVFLVGFCIGFFLPRSNSLGGITASGSNVFSGGVTSTSTSVGIGATSILTRNTSRQYVMICNDGSGVVNLHFTNTSTGVSTATGIPIASSTTYDTCYEIGPDNMYIGQIYGIADATSTIKLLYK